MYKGRRLICQANIVLPSNKIFVNSVDELTENCKDLSNKVVLTRKMVLNFILRMKIKVVLYCGILGILLMIFTAFIELFNALFYPQPDGEWKIASDIIEGDLKMVSFYN